MSSAIRYIRLVLSLLPAIARGLRAALYVLRNRGQLRKDLIWAWRALSDFELDTQERRKLQEVIDRHGRGIGLWELSLDSWLRED